MITELKGDFIVRVLDRDISHIYEAQRIIAERNALFHARDKKADIAVIYSKGHIFSRKSVEEGLKMYEAATSYRFKEIMVVSDTGRVHIHIHK